MNSGLKRNFSYVFVVTYGRSGSTLLQKILQSIPGYFIRGENYLIAVTLMNAVKKARQTQKEFGPTRLAPENPWFGADEIDADRFAARLRDVFVDEIIQPPENARVVGFKEIRWFELPGNLFFELLDFLRTHFSPCRFIFNTRAAADVADSGFWQNQERTEVFRMVHAQNALYAAYRDLHPDNCFIVDYDRYIDDVDHIAELFRFLGETFDRERIQTILSTKLEH